MSSALGMERSVKTSQLLKYRAESVIPERVQEMERAILDKNFPLFAELTMKDSNQMHAICLDTYPPCAYMNDVSRLIVDFVHEYNSVREKVSVCSWFIISVSDHALTDCACR